jgi:hypothetical protein
MDRVTEYRQHVQELINRYAAQRPKDKGVETQIVVDMEHDHYQLLNVGWEDEHQGK